jgi:hypothetical protein
MVEINHMNYAPTCTFIIMNILVDSEENRIIKIILLIKKY